MELQQLKHVFFIGIGGIGMSALARYFNQKGIHVSGYDKTETTLTQALVSEGIHVHYEDSISNIPKDIDLAIYTPAVPRNHQQLIYCQANKEQVPLMKRSEVLGLISKNSDAIAVAGTHGKTSTSAITAHLMKHAGVNVNAFIGGIMADYNTNYFVGDSHWVVLEADEYDRSFLHLMPEISILQSMDADHLDIYGSAANMEASFVEFIEKTAYGGTLIINADLIPKFDKGKLDLLKSEYKLITYGPGASANIVIKDYRVEEQMTRWTLDIKGQEIPFMQFMPGMHNVMNATAAIIACMEAGCSVQSLQMGLQVFKGIKRRFERIVQRDVIYIDDYAHHPTELRAAISAAKDLYDGKILGIFQPHLYSRTKDFHQGFAEALDQLDETILMDIYPARELPIKGVTSQMIIDKMTSPHKQVLSAGAILEKVAQKDYHIVMTLGAGDIDLLVPRIKEILI